MLTTILKWFLKDLGSLLSFIKSLEAHIEQVVTKAEADIQKEVDRITIVKASAREVEEHLLDLIRSTRLNAAIEEENLLDNIRILENGISHLMHVKTNLVPSAPAAADTAPSSVNTDA